MSTPLRLVLFDVDGTLVDSQASIVNCMTHSFQALSVDIPEREAILSIVGLSLPAAIARLAPDQPDAMRAALVEGYKQAFHDQRLQTGVASSPLFPGAREVIERLRVMPDVLLGVATGKSRRGLDALIEGHGLDGCFVTLQVADHHPSKPHPSMVQAALAETGVEQANAVMIGDTSYDMDMAAAAGIPGIGVTWGYHDHATLTSAAHIIETFDQLPEVLVKLWN